MGTERIRVQLPLAGSVTSRLMKAIGAAWPDARIDTSAQFHADGQFLVFIVPTDTDPGVPLDMAALSDDGRVEVPPGVDIEAVLASVHDGSFGMAMPEWFARIMLEGVRATLDANTEGVNYIEQQFHGEDEDGRIVRYTVTVGRPKGRTPHELRVEADDRAAAALALARKLHGRLTPARLRDLDLTPEEESLLTEPDEAAADGDGHTLRSYVSGRISDRQALAGWTFSEPYQIGTTWYRDVAHPDNVVAFRHSVDGLVKHGSPNAALPDA